MSEKYLLLTFIFMSFLKEHCNYLTSSTENKTKLNNFNYSIQFNFLQHINWSLQTQIVQVDILYVCIKI